MPEASGGHVLNSSFLAVRQLNLGFLDAFAWSLTAFRAGVFFAFTRPLATDLARLRRLRLTDARIIAALFAGLRFHGVAVPFSIIEMMMCFDEIVDGEIVLTLIQAGSASDDLFELDHGVNRAHEDNIADIAGIDSGGKFL